MCCLCVLTLINCASCQGGGCYSLVSSINHISPFAVSGKIIYYITHFHLEYNLYLLLYLVAWYHNNSFLPLGHYICDGVDPDVGQEDPTDRWFTYNDTVVTETSGDTVCNKRERESYILFYKRMVSDKFCAYAMTLNTSWK